MIQYFKAIKLPGTVPTCTLINVGVSAGATLDTAVALSSLSRYELVVLAPDRKAKGQIGSFTKSKSLATAAVNLIDLFHSQNILLG